MLQTCKPCLQAEFSRRIAQLERDSKWKMENREAELVAQHSAKQRQVGGLLQVSQSHAAVPASTGRDRLPLAKLHQVKLQRGRPGWGLLGHPELRQAMQGALEVAAQPRPVPGSRCPAGAGCSSDGAQHAGAEPPAAGLS